MHRDHANHPRPHLQMFSKFEVHKYYIANEHINMFNKPKQVFGVEVGVVCVVHMYIHIYIYIYVHTYIERDIDMLLYMYIYIQREREA